MKVVQCFELLAALFVYGAFGSPLPLNGAGLYQILDSATQQLLGGNSTLGKASQLDSILKHVLDIHMPNTAVSDSILEIETRIASTGNNDNNTTDNDGVNNTNGTAVSTKLSVNGTNKNGFSVGTMVSISSVSGEGSKGASFWVSADQLPAGDVQVKQGSNVERVPQESQVSGDTTEASSTSLPGTQVAVEQNQTVAIPTMTIAPSASSTENVREIKKGGLSIGSTVISSSSIAKGLKNESSWVSSSQLPVGTKQVEQGTNEEHVSEERTTENSSLSSSSILTVNPIRGRINWESLHFSRRTRPTRKTLWAATNPSGQQ